MWRAALAALSSISIAWACAASSQAGPVRFSRGPEVKVSGSKATIGFAVSAPTDVEVAIVDAQGRVVRHLAAGALGGKAAPPEPLKPGLAQELTWDGTDDAGKPLAADLAGLKVRLRAGLTAKLGRVIGEPGRTAGKIYGLATDEKGQLYVASGSVYSSAPVFSIKVFDRKGKYLRTILPMPASLSPEQVAEYGKVRQIDGRLTPSNYNPLVPYVQQGGIAAFIGNAVRDGVLWLVNTEGRLCRIRTDGSAVKWRSAAKSMSPSGGPMCWAVSGDNQTLYLTGWWNSRASRSKGKIDPNDGVIYKVNPATGKAAELVRIDVPKKSYWLTEFNGWYHYRNWGRRNGCAALHGMAVDKQGRLVVCDRVNQRLAVYGGGGKLLGQTPIEWPDLVALSPAGGTVYVSTRKVIDGYKAINEFRVVKLSSAVDGKVLAETTVRGSNAPSMALDASAEPAVIWLSNVGKAGESVVRIEDRGKTLVVTGGLNADLPPADGIVKAWVDPAGDDVYVNNGWNGLSRYDGLTGKGGPIKIKAIDMAIDPAGRLYLYGRKGWNEPIYRCDRNFKPVPFSGTGKPTTGKSSAGREVYGRYGMGWSNKGIAIGPGGRIFVRSMYDWCKYFVTVFKPDGTAESHARVSGGILGPLDAGSGGIKVDRQGCFYVGTHGQPKGTPKAHPMKGCIVKVGPEGGGIVPKKGKLEGIQFAGYFFEGAVKAYAHLAPRADKGCVCKEARFGLDGFGRLYVPDVMDFCIRVYDNAGNPIAKFGHYGNSDSAGADSPVPEPAIPFGWPLTCSINRAGRLYVADVLNQRIVRVDVNCAVEATEALK